MNNKRILFAVAMLAIATLACALPGGLGSNVVFSDDFSSEGQWGIGSTADSSVQYVDGTLQISVFTPYVFSWSPSNTEDVSNVHIEVTAVNNNIDQKASFGIICNMQVTDVSYYFAITPAGQYVIARSALATDDVFLTNNDTWEFSDAIPVDAPSYRIGADCGGDGTLKLYVNGQQVDSAVDTTYTSGSVALFAWSDEEENATNVSFDDFQVTRLP